MVVYIALFSWPLVVVILFNRTSPQVALISSVIAGYLLLPPNVGINLPLLPRIDKNLVPSISAAVMALVITRQGLVRAAANRGGSAQQPPGLPGWVPRSGMVRVLILALVGGAFMTTWLNGDQLVYGVRNLPGLKPYDAFSTTMIAIVGLLPFFLARKFLAHPDSHRTLLLIFGVAGLLYSLPTLFEVRMSPQINKAVYGFFPSDWRQAIRGDGFRPLVFLKHGLLLGLFLSSAVLAALAYFKATHGNRRWIFLGVAFWLLLTLVLAKSLGALLTAIVLFPVLLFFGVRLQLLCAAAIAVLVLTYPVLRSTGMVPVDQVVSFIETIDPDRAQSLQFRLDNEDRLLSKANQRPAFGWGGWGRARAFDERGNDTSVTDGLWVITIGEGGWARYIGELGLLTMSIFFLTLHRRRYEITLATSGLCLVLAANLMDLIPNSGLTPITWLMAGALAGRLELQKIASTSQMAPEVVEMVQTSRYSRPRPVRAPQPAAARPERLAYTRQTERPHEPLRTKL